MADMAGKRLGDYELIERIGGGGMAEVYRARQLTAFGREVALKVIRTDLSASEEFRARFLREAQAISRLSHPNILPLIEFGEEDETLYLVMPLIREGTLRDLLRSRNGALPLEEGLPLFIQLCNAVQYAHEQGIIHRDIKPQNVLLQQHTHVLLTDFGIARDRSGKQITSIGLGIGTADYMSPEQALGEADIRSDIYSLGIVLYQLLTGLLPYQGTTPLEVIVKHSNDPPPDPRKLNPALPDQIVAVIETVLAKDPNERFQTASALSRAAQQALAEVVSLPRSGISGPQVGSVARASARLSTQQIPPAHQSAPPLPGTASPSGYTTRQVSGPSQPTPTGSKALPGAPIPATPASDYMPPQPAYTSMSGPNGWKLEAVAYPLAPNPMPVAPAHKKRRAGLVALLAILVLALALSAGLVVLGLGGKGPLATLGKHPTPVATATPSLPPGFSLYTNLDHSFKLIYPTSWQKGPSSSGTGVDFQGPAGASFIATNLGTNQGDPVTADGAFCALLSGSPGSPHDAIVGKQRWTQETCDSLPIFGNLHAVVETITYKGFSYMIAYSATHADFANDKTQFFALMENSFTFLT
jgi:serine/threonine protein kinase